MTWHTPVEYDSTETADLLKRRIELARRYEAAAMRKQESYQKIVDRGRRLGHKAAVRMQRELREVRELHDRAIDHYQSVIAALGIVLSLVGRSEREEEMDRQNFYEQAMAQTMPDEFSVTLRRNPDQPTEQHTFSQEAMEGIGYQLHDFMLARVVAYLAREGKAPAGMRADLRLSWDEQPSDEELEQQEMSPWFAITDGGETSIPVDGKHRLSMFLTERREGLDAE